MFIRRRVITKIQKGSRKHFAYRKGTVLAESKNDADVVQRAGTLLEGSKAEACPFWERFRSTPTFLLSSLISNSRAFYYLAFCNLAFGRSALPSLTITIGAITTGKVQIGVRALTVQAIKAITFCTLIISTLATVSCTKTGSSYSATVNQTSPEELAKDPSGAREVLPIIPTCRQVDTTKLAQVPGHTEEVVGLFPSKDEKGNPGLYSIDSAGGILNWDLKKGSAFRMGRVSSPISHLALSPECKFLAIARGSGVELYQLADLSKVATLPKIRGKVTDLIFSPAGDALLVASADGNLYRWRFIPSETREERRHDFQRYNGHAAVPGSLAYHPFNRVFFSGDWSGAIFAWLSFDKDDPFGGEYDKDLFGNRFLADRSTRMTRTRELGIAVDHLVVSPDGRSLFAALNSGVVEVWQIKGFIKASESQAHKGYIYAIATDPDGTRLATGGRDNRVRIWKILQRERGAKVESNTTELEYEVSITNVRSLTFVGSERVYAGTLSGSVVELNLSKLQKVLPTPSPTPTPHDINGSLL